MSQERPNYHNHLYTGILIAGLFVVYLTFTITNSKIDHFEENTTRVHRLISAVESDLDTLEREAENITIEIKDISSSESTINSESTSRLQQLKASIYRLRSDIAEKQKLVISLNLLKTGNLSQIKTLFWVASALMAIGIIMCLSGVFALLVKLEFFQDRRIKERKESN